MTSPSTPCRSRRSSQRGAAVMIEFVLASMMLTPLTIGTIAVGLGLARYIQTGAVCRSAASMFVRGADFTQTGYKNVLGKLAEGLGMTDSAGAILANGNGVAIFTVLMRIGDRECAGGGMPANDSTCTNRYRVVVTKQVVVGNASLRDSAFANPVGGTQSADGTFSANFYLKNSSAAAAQFGTAANDDGDVPGAPLHLAAGEITYLVETFFTAPEINLFPQSVNYNGYYHRNFF